MVSLHEARLRRLLSIQALARRADVAINTVHFAEMGRQVPRFASMRKIAAALELEPTDIDEFRAAIEAAVDGKAPGGAAGREG